MTIFEADAYRAPLESDPPAFVDRVDTPWEHIPDLEQGVCFIQTDDDCSDSLLKVPQLLEVCPRCTQHGGATIRHEQSSNDEAAPPQEQDEDTVEIEFDEVERCPKCGDLLVLRKSKQGPAMVCVTYPDCRYVKLDSTP